MTNYIIGISGSGGGDSGPNNLYQLLKLKFTNRVILYDTIPNNEKDNINNILTPTEISKLSKRNYKAFHIVV